MYILFLKVYLNGLTVDADTRLKVKHKARKSDSVSSPNSGELYTHLSSTASSSANEDDLHGAFHVFSYLNRSKKSVR